MKFGKMSRKFKDSSHRGWPTCPLMTKIGNKCRTTIKEQLRRRTLLYGQEFDVLLELYPRHLGF